MAVDGARNHLSQKWDNLERKIRPIFLKYFGLNWPGFITILIWSTTVIVLFALNVRALCPMIDDYYHNNTMTQIEVKTTNEAKLPKLTICIPYYSDAISNVSGWLKTAGPIFGDYLNKTDESCFACKLMKNHSWDVWNDKEFKEELIDLYVEYSTFFLGVDKKIRDIDNSSFKILMKSKGINETVGQSLLTNIREWTGKNLKVDTSFANQFDGLLMTFLLRKIAQYKPDFEILHINRTTYNWNQPIIDAVWRYFMCLNRENYFTTSGIQWDSEVAKIMVPEDNRRGLCLFDSTAFANLPNKVVDNLFRRLFKAIGVYVKRYHEVGPDEEEKPLEDEPDLEVSETQFCLPITNYSDIALEWFEFDPSVIPINRGRIYFFSINFY